MFARRFTHALPSARLVVLAATISIAPARWINAHEGHAPLPTKGVQVDVMKGLITLSPEAKKSLGLQTETVEQRVFEEKTLAYATLVTPWQQQYFLSSQLSGRIAALHVVTGEAVEPGQILAEIASPELEALQLEMRSAVNEMNLSARQSERLRGLLQNQAVAEREYIEANARYEQGKNAVRIARSKLRSLGITDTAIDESLLESSDRRLLRAPLLSPIRGTVSHADLTIGRVIAANEHLFEVNDLSTLWVKIGMVEHDVARIRVGQRVILELSAFPQQQVETVVSVAALEVDPITHVANAWAEIKNPSAIPQYLPGMHGTAKIVISEPSGLPTVPVSALLGSGAERYVLVEVAATSKGYEYRRQSVVVASQNSSIAQVRAGSLFPGDRVIKTGGQVLSSFFILGSLRLSDEGIRNVGLKVEPVAMQIVEDVLSMDGVIDLPPGRVASISSQLAGTLSRIAVARGQEVSAGQILAEVAGLPLQDTQLVMLKSDLDVRLLDQTLQRLNSTGLTPLVAARRIWETENAREVAVNRRESARQTLITMGMTADEVDEVLTSGDPRATLPIRSPINGVVVRFDKVLGQGIRSDDPILEIHDLSHPWVKGFVSEADAPQLRIGTPTRIRLLSDPDFVATGKIVRSARMLSEENGTLAIWIEMDNPHGKPLQRNLLARISATLSAPTAKLAVPLSAIVREQTRNYVFFQRQRGLLERISVELGRADDRYVEIRGGLTIGDPVAVQGTAELQTTYASVR